MIRDENCDCDNDHLKTILHPDWDEEVDAPVWECEACGAFSRGGW